MKINKFISLAAIALMAIGAMGFITTRTHAQSGTTPAPQVQVTEAPDNEAAVGPDTDNVEEQVGDQNAQVTTADSANEPVEAKSSDGQDAAPTGTPSISSDAALMFSITFNASPEVKSTCSMLSLTLFEFLTAIFIAILRSSILFPIRFIFAESFFV